MTIDLDTLEKLEQEATAGIWRVSPHATHYVDTTGERSDTVCKCYQDSPKRGEPAPDAAFIAALRNAAPALIALAREALRSRDATDGTTHAENCHLWGRRHYECAVGKIEDLQAENAQLQRYTRDNWPDLIPHDGMSGTDSAIRVMRCLDVRLGEQSQRIGEMEAENAWQPIETAPKDGTSVLATNGECQAVVWWAEKFAIWTLYQCACCDDGEQCGELVGVIGWKPLKSAQK